MKHENQSFTLIEILVVIVIIGILSSFIFFTINDSVEKALVSEWTFDTGVTTAENTATNDDVKDAWGNNNGIIYGNPKIKKGDDCIYGKCLEFNGYNGRGVIYTNNSSLKFNENFTISFWFYKNQDTSSSSEYVLTGGCTDWPNENYCRYRFVFTSVSKNLKFCIQPPGTSWTCYGAYINNFPEKKWHHIVGIWNSKEKKVYIYLNSKFHTKSNEIPINLTKSFPSNLCIGALNSGYYFVHGKLDHIQIYNNLLSTSQIKQNYLAGLNNLYAKELISKTEYNNNINNLSKK